MYKEFFDRTDFLISSVTRDITSVSTITRQVLASSICILAFATYENSIKKILNEYCLAQSAAFGHFFQSKFNKINGRIKYNILIDEFIIHFGPIYKSRFEDLVSFERDIYLNKDNVCIKTCYNNLITWRHNIAHAAVMIQNATINEVIESYHYGKIIIDCLYVSLHTK